MMDNDTVDYGLKQTIGQKVPFGREMRKQHFLFREQHVNLNQGVQDASSWFRHLS